MSGGLHSLATIIKRLEAATSRLEDIATENDSKAPKSDELRDEPSPSTFNAVPAASVPPPASAVAVVDPPTVVDFDAVIVQGKLKPFLELTRSFAGATVVEQVALVENEFAHLRSLLMVAASCKKPDQKSFGDLLVPLQKDIESITRLKEANRKDRVWFNHLSTVAEGAPIAGWVTVEPKPGPYVGEIKDSTQFYGNRVIKEFKEKDPKHAEWVRAYIALLEEVRLYVMKHHTTGLVWNPKGVSASEYKPGYASASAGPPSPPPPPAAPAPPTALASTGSGGTAAVFAELNRGEEVTKGLRKVDKSEMTHKNPALRASSVVPSSSPASSSPKRPVKPAKPQALAGKKPSKLTLEGSKWVIEYQENESSLVVENGENNQTVNVFGCKNSTIVIKGKVNAVTLVNCTKTSVLVESVISTVSVTNSPSFALQITGAAPTIQLDSTDSGQIYLSKACIGVEITTAKCSSINVSIPVEGEEEGVFEEQPVPEMFKTVVKDGKLVTTIVEHAG